MKFPEIRVMRNGAGVQRVEWDPLIEDAPVFDITGMRVLKVESRIQPGELPTVAVTFLARLVEFDEDDLSDSGSRATVREAAEAHERSD